MGLKKIISMGNKLLVLGAGILQVPIIKKAKELGFFVIAIDGNKDAIGLKYADKPIVADITSEEEMLGIAKSEKINGVIHPCSEVSMVVMGRINDELGLCGITKEQALCATNKNLMRRAFEAEDAPSPKSMCFNDEYEAWKVFKDHFVNDCILKPSRNSGSRGISKISQTITHDDFKRLFNISKSESRDKSVMLEDFIDGPEFSVEIIVWKGEIMVLAVTDKLTTESPYFVELGHSQPSCFSSEIIDSVQSAAITGVRALKVNNCACHAEIKIDKRTISSSCPKAYIMEIGARMGGDFISTVLTPISSGIDMTASAIYCAMGMNPNLVPLTQPRGVCIRYFRPKSGKVVGIENIEMLQDDNVLDWDIYYSINDTIPPLKSSLSRAGHVIVVADNVKKAINQANYLVENVVFEIEA